jgi:hypothetical protein
MSLPYAPGSATSAAAAAAAAGDANRHRAAVFAAILAAGYDGLTRQEIERQTGLNGNTVRPRVVELANRGLIKPSDEIRRNAGGRACEVLVSATLPAPVAVA